MISVIPEHPHIFVGLKKKKTNRSIFFFVDFLILKPRRKIKSLPSWISGGPRLQRTTGKRLCWELSPGSLLLLRAFPGSLRPRALSREVPGPILASARAGQSGAAMSSDFEGYEQDFAVLTAEITNKIARVPRLPPDEKKQMVANVEKQLEEAKELLEQMDLEVREIPPQSRGMYSNRMRSYKQEMGKLETDFKRSRIAYSDEVRNELLGDDGNSSENQRAHLLDNTERLERSSRRLEAGYQIAVETGKLWHVAEGSSLYFQSRRHSGTIHCHFLPCRHGYHHLIHPFLLQHELLLHPLIPCQCHHTMTLSFRFYKTGKHL
ncbi:vesicle transport through interaction with t-SNAREs homolog 1A isoform X7 [Loxodonta africana]|uniref:vesicle transport through interaction with t-SNAREs homolog 1A isoform X7 n=1 Tax=Loxodonta africana TaxID=9785 RepID=UPI0030D16317